MIIYQVDAFTSTPFSGNPAGVVPLQESYSDPLLLSIAWEINCSETAYYTKMKDGAFSLRWFTPVAEVELCGHATIATAHILWETGEVMHRAPITFRTLSGELLARWHDDWIIIDFPAERETAVETPPLLTRALGVQPLYVGKNRFDYLVELESEEAVRACQPDSILLRQLPCRGVCITSRSSSGEFDFLSRFFAPSLNIIEDPVTGSAHCCLGPYWQRKLGKDSLIAFQASPRGGVVKMTMQGDRVLLGGQAVTVLRGEMDFV